MEKSEISSKVLAPPAGGIPECLQREPFFKKRVKNIYPSQDSAPYSFVYVFHEGYRGIIRQIIFDEDIKKLKRLTAVLF